MFITCRNICQTFYSSNTAVALFFLSLLRGAPRVSTSTRSFEALKGVSFDVSSGERVGIIGHNGAGKTTLLKIIAGLLQPTSGVLEVQGHVNCVMTLGVGLREDLSGRENIYVDGEMNGKSRSEVAGFIDKLIEFTEIGEFIDYPVRTYSSGMKSRLAFSMIVHITPEILIIDEALSAGDVNFSTKASARMKEICDKGMIHLIVSHSMGTIVQMCNRCIWMDHGKAIMDGDPKEVTEAYLKAVRHKDEEILRDSFRKRIGGGSVSDVFEIKHLRFLDASGNAKTIFAIGEEMTVAFTVKSNRRIERPDCRISFERTDGILVSENSAAGDGFELGPVEGEAEFRIMLGAVCYGQNTYEVLVEFIDTGLEGRDSILAFRKEILKIENPIYPHINPVFYLPVRWSINEASQ